MAQSPAPDQKGAGAWEGDQVLKSLRWAHLSIAIAVLLIVAACLGLLALHKRADEAEARAIRMATHLSQLEARMADHLSGHAETPPDGPAKPPPEDPRTESPRSSPECRGARCVAFRKGATGVGIHAKRSLASRVVCSVLNGRVIQVHRRHQEADGLWHRTYCDSDKAGWVADAFLHAPDVQPLVATPGRP